MPKRQSRNLNLLLIVLGGSLAAGCGSEGSSGGLFGGGDPGADDGGGKDGGGGNDDGGDGDGGGDGGSTDGSGDGGDGGATDGGGTDGGTTDGGGTDDGGTDSGGSSSDSGPPWPKFDVGGGGDGDPGDCDCVPNEWSYVWIANSSESTVSKINTRTLTEEGRYLTRSDGAGNPSRTSVSVDGRAVAVANRHVGITKIWARPEDCAGANTSTGPGDVKPWGTDDCVAWFTDFPGKTVQRPVAWTPGVLNTTTCEYEHQKIWTTTGSGGSGPGMCGAEGVTVHLLDGDTGIVDAEVYIPDVEFDCDHTGTLLGLGLGPYGGAVDNEGNFWFHGWGNNKLVRVELVTGEYEITPGGSYGITVDTEGRVWTNWVARYDPVTDQWANPPASVGGSGGIAQDLQGRIWAAIMDGVIWVDMETLAVGDTIPLPYSGQAKGVSADIDGYVWVTFQGDTNAYRIDPDTYAFETVTGLNDPYTYSDMTGGQISNVNCNPPQ